MSDAANPEDIVGLYQRHADAWDRDRRADPVIEQGWMDRFTALLQPGASVLDIGCGSGQPIAKYLIERGYDVVGVDSSPPLIKKCCARFPGNRWIIADMRALALHRTFDALIAWNSLFHLSHEHQRAMFPIFRCHASPGALLLFTTGSDHGVAIGWYQGEPLYHASLSSEEYRTLLDSHGFSVVAHSEDDPDCGGHAVWLARLKQ
ncbi:class I SAM-dependent methyltransferase [Steroidobacter sp. S1-65]|uniref:Class I SAM-dependent methyltransferase n=1 Tax=Steroidobacter gossypii TaxID=2805490 RepID=A0ABS1X2N5_9GAMM|nr:class I SAM-dependent methyltransferase [Steroidobacter gossypii]MBM0107491.1 class I SAM-dependent methyltransferase [Steroidobacter gossypii]